MDKGFVFVETSGIISEDLLTDDVAVKTAVLEDFVWFMGQSKKYKSTQDKIKDYIRHLQLKANLNFQAKASEIGCFKQLDIEKFRACLQKSN